MSKDACLVSIVDSNMSHAIRAKNVLEPFYNVSVHEKSNIALDHTRSQRPSCLIVCDSLSPHSSIDFIKTLRNEGFLQNCGLIYIAASEVDPEIDTVKALNVDAILTKPYTPTSLIKEVSAQVSNKVEKSWEKFPELQRNALKKTASVFHDIENVLITGENISFNDVKNNCKSLIDVVESNNFDEILEGIKNHDNYTYAHSMRVATLLTLLGHAAGFKHDDQLIMSSGGLLHDVGKMMIPHNILNKPGKLTEEEFEIMKTHVPETMEYLKRSDDIPQGVLIIAEQHHEKIDGTGYPHGLKGAQLNELARMAAIVDVFSALTDRRVYKPAMETSKAYAILEDMTDHLDQHYVKMFKNILVDTGILV